MRKRDVSLLKIEKIERHESEKEFQKQLNANKKETLKTSKINIHTA